MPATFMQGDILPPEIMVRREDWDQGVAVYMRQRTAGQGAMTALPVVMQKVEPGQLTQPMLRLDLDTAQQLMDELWRCGLRPTEGTGSAGSLAATERHLKDMQTVAMALLRKDGAQL